MEQGQTILKSGDGQNRYRTWLSMITVHVFGM